MADAKQAFVEEHKRRAETSSSGSDQEYGTKASGFADGGPFSCADCVHQKMEKGSSVCDHPKVNEDPELKSRKRVEGLVVVGPKYCCRYVRPH